MMDHEFAVPSGAPPRALSKRGSLPPAPSKADIRRLKLARQLSTSHPKLLAIGSGGGSSIDNIKKGDMRQRSNSLHLLAADLKRNLSASNLAALSDSNLSITKALPTRSYDKPNALGAAEKQYFDVLVKRYFNQLTVGCGSRECTNKFCFSCQDRLKVSSDIAAIISIQLASDQRRFLCTPISETFTSALPTNVFQPKNNRPHTQKQFLQTLYSCTPFASLFVDSPSTCKEDILINNFKSNHNCVMSKVKGQDRSESSGSQRKLASSTVIGTGKSTKISYGSPQGDGLSDSIKSRTTKSGGAASKVGESLAISDGKQHLIKWKSGYDLPHQDAASVDYQGSAPHLGQSSKRRSSHGSVDDLLPSKSESLKSRSRGHHSRSFTSPVGSGKNRPVSLRHGPPDDGVTSSPSRLLSPSEALDETDSVRDFERSLSMELSFENLEELSLTHLTLPMLKDIVDQYEDCGDPAFLINTIRTVFTSSQALNASFKKDDSNPESTLCIDSVQRSYDILWRVQPRDLFITHMINALEILLMSLTNSTIEPQQINQLQILLECPILESHHEILKSFCHILSSLTSPTRAGMVEAISSYQIDHFQRLIKFFKNHLGSMLKPQQSMPDTLVDIARVLHIFYDASILAQIDNNVTVATRKMFYSEELSRGMDYQSEYSKWSRRSKYNDSIKETGSNKNHGRSMLEYPFLLDPPSKVHVLHLDAVVQMRHEYQRAILHQARVNQALKYLSSNRSASVKDSIKSAMCPFLVLEIKREMLIQDTLQQIKLKENDLKKPLKIKYVGGGEQGLDMGGLQKEFFQLIAAAVFDPTYGMFSYSEESRKLWINGASLESNNEFELVGIILGLAIYNGVILNVHFPMAIYKKLHGESLDILDLTDVLPSVGKGLQDLLEYEGDVEETFCQTFQISYMALGEMVTVDLLPNGSQIPVTNKNRCEFVRLYKEHILVESVAKQFQAFARGFHMVCGGPALQLFEAEETELLICGSPELDFKALEKSATYEDGFNRRHHTIKAFWDIVHSMSDKQKKKLLHFITGSDRVPLRGLSSLPIVIQRNGPDSKRLPTAMTCFNRLLLPSYATTAKLRDRLSVAIQYGQGFGLT